MTEHSIQKASVAWLNDQAGCIAITVYSGAVPTFGGHWKKNGPDRPKGWPDCLFIYKGITRYIEFKAEKGRLSPEQRAMHERIVSCGAEVHVCRSIGDVQRLWASISGQAPCLQLRG